MKGHRGRKRGQGGGRRYRGSGEGKGRAQRKGEGEGRALAMALDILKSAQSHDKTTHNVSHVGTHRSESLMPIPSMEPLIELLRVAWALCGPDPIEGPLGSEAYPAADVRQ